VADLTLLVFCDVHFMESDEPDAEGLERNCLLGAELSARAIRDARRRGGFDALVLPGDFLQDGTKPGASLDLPTLAKTIRAEAGEVPLIVAPGNHDGDPNRVLAAFGDHLGMHEVKGYRLYSFLDVWDENDVCRRPPGGMEAFRAEAACSPDKPLIVVQHNPLHPPIESDYPFTHADRDVLMRTYSELGVLLSLSGHAHWGQEPCEAGGVQYYTCPALACSPFVYALIELKGREVTVREHGLKLPDTPPLYDVHAHTHYAYCGRGMTPEGNLHRARLFGLGGICLTEHADQLYLTEQEYASGYVRRDPDFWRAPRSPQSERMPAFRKELQPLRSEFVGLGAEVELDGKGRPTLREEHRDGWDVLLGAVHWVPEETERMGLEAVKERFMLDCRSLLEFGVEVLAHPFRFFRRSGLEPPRDLYEPLAELLARYGVAAEVNFHTNEPDPEFFSLCLERGVKLALGSDAHHPSEVGDFHRHLHLLRQIAPAGDIERILFTPRLGRAQEVLDAARRDEGTE